MKLLRIIKAKYKTTKENLFGIEPEDWVRERRKICDSCPSNSKNVQKKDKDFKYYLWGFLNLGKKRCVKCGCDINSKSSDPFEICPDDKWKELYKSGF